MVAANKEESSFPGAQAIAQNFHQDVPLCNAIK